jgi:hypothetical protein
MVLKEIYNSEHCFVLIAEQYRINENLDISAE